MREAKEGEACVRFFQAGKRRRIFPFGPHPPGFATSNPGNSFILPQSCARERERESLGAKFGLTWSDASTSFARPDSLAHRLYERASHAYRQTD